MGDLTLMMDRAMKGDRAAQGRLVREIEPELRKLALHWIRRYSAKDVVSTTDVIDRAFEKMMRLVSRDWQHRGQFYAFACRNIMGIVFDLVNGKTLLSNSDAPERLPAPDAGLTLNSLMSLQQALADLGRDISEEHRVIVEMRFLGDCTLDEVAQMLGINRDRVYQKSKIALAYLREKLADSFPNFGHSAFAIEES